jgi:dihydropteroate synthase
MTKFICGRFEFVLNRPLVMGIVNVTPDSFSDGGQFVDPAAAIAHGLALVEQGAELLDIGGESTRPGATPVSEAEEARRVLPVIRELARQTRVPISVDTQKPAVARAAIEAGASIVNDIAANRTDDEMWRVVAGLEAGYICMHMLGEPQTMQSAPRYQNVAAEVSRFFAGRLERLAACGIAADRVVLDPGIGFGKTVEHNLQLLARLGTLGAFNRPVMLGVSRKSFLGKIVNAAPHERLPGSLACACLALPNAQIVRAHDVRETVQAVRVAEAILKERS